MKVESIIWHSNIWAWRDETLGTEQTDCECGPGEGIKTWRDGTNEEQMFSCKHGGCICDPGFLSKSEISAAPLETHTHIQTYYRGQVSSSHKIGNISNIFKNGQTIKPSTHIPLGQRRVRMQAKRKWAKNRIKQEAQLVDTSCNFRQEDEPLNSFTKPDLDMSSIIPNLWSPRHVYPTWQFYIKIWYMNIYEGIQNKSSVCSV